MIITPGHLFMFHIIIPRNRNDHDFCCSSRIITITKWSRIVERFWKMFISIKLIISVGMTEGHTQKETKSTQLKFLLKVQYVKISTYRHSNCQLLLTVTCAVSAHFSWCCPNSPLEGFILSELLSLLWKQTRDFCQQSRITFGLTSGWLEWG